jgi:hypothetical protein
VTVEPLDTVEPLNVQFTGGLTESVALCQPSLPPVPSAMQE